ncbi:MAG: selenoprotein B glycine/betaine/sarcosine/D-proline reductase [Chloroflexi bacterium]|nr:selenoprotein B glycine/betaine/sarcosine/D-proline reductase [Chloroflexota bacterium]MDP6420773.1 glycine/sarcosine/betaine reductase selenoprotein B family protein [SAR202 cluster bacterium]MDP6663149.1 glycine/sarcosine/betaine reductase selenoprotein B family protein [SAR202 cluster bacterium]MQG56373.1 selenoprotein B glycine/betaine/sarcosine/D-proline reductase [SAR202 cluster bacterium]HAL47018.1 selenoprotein B glycine/betaine/sarcosine/D-proline reductase [Dehalococcoidia bacteriu
MVRLDQVSDVVRTSLLGIECPVFDGRPWVEGPPVSQRRVAIISTAGLHLRGDRLFNLSSGDAKSIPGEYRVIPGDTEANDLVMSHVSTNYDRTGFQQDWNVVFPLDRLRELARDGAIGSVADFHYSFMGANTPAQMEAAARTLAGLLKRDNVDAALLVPV